MSVRDERGPILQSHLNEQVVRLRPANLLIEFAALPVRVAVAGKVFGVSCETCCCSEPLSKSFEQNPIETKQEQKWHR